MTEKEISKQITRYINGELNDQEEDLLWEEFLENRAHYQLFETELSLADLYRNKKYRVDESDNNNRPNRLYSVWTASLAALILVSSMLYLFSYQSDTLPTSYALSEIELTQMLGSSIFRNESPEAAQVDQQINRALTLALSGRSQEAAETLDNIVLESLSGTQKVLVRFNLGILAYNAANYDESLKNFSDLNRQLPADTPDYIAENTQWYISNIYLKQGEVDRATQLLRQIVSDEGIHAKKAADLLSDLDE